MPAIQFSREYLCEPIHDVASMFPNDILEKARDKDLVLLDRAETDYNEEGEPVGIFGQHFIGWDTAIASDKNADFTAMMVLRTPPNENVKQIVGIVHEKGLGGAAQKKHILLLNNRFKPDLIELEGNNFQRMFAAELKDMRDDIPIKTFMTTRQRKESMFMSLLMAFEQGQIRTPYGDERSRTFTHKLEQELNRFGMQKNGKLESVGTHDDLAMALALANWGTKEFRGTVVLLDDWMPGFGDWLDNTVGGKNTGGWMIP
jgi:phage terminase large subunit-like protein